MVDTALNCIKLLEENGFEDIVVSLKSPYPIHLGITATGPPPGGIIKSAVGIGALLSEGIGDTIRVSLTGSSVEEVKIAYEILKYLQLVDIGPTLITCPTCGRKNIHAPLKVAVMGCEVNGPGEAMEADIGIACTRQGGILFKKGRLLNKVRKDQLLDTLIRELHQMDQGSGSR